jgi:hypothetical protein
LENIYPSLPALCIQKRFIVAIVHIFRFYLRFMQTFLPSLCCIIQARSNGPDVIQLRAKIGFIRSLYVTIFLDTFILSANIFMQCACPAIAYHLHIKSYFLVYHTATRTKYVHLWHLEKLYSIVYINRWHIWTPGPSKIGIHLGFCEEIGHVCGTLWRNRWKWIVDRYTFIQHY